VTSQIDPRPGENLDVSRMPIYILLFRLGKQVIRPSGMDLTRRMLELLDVQASDEVVEFAPGLGATAKLTLRREPAHYTAIERDEASMKLVTRYLKGPDQRSVIGRAENTELGDASATLVYGEAMLTMQTASNKDRIIAEAARILKPGGRYGIHEVCLQPDDLGDADKSEIERSLSEATHVSTRPLKQSEWRTLLERAGLQVTGTAMAPFRLLSPPRVIRDEGIAGALRLAKNVLSDATARRRVLDMRSVLHWYRNSLAGIAIVAIKPE
jgi:SAM-dependent methyltransferase